MCCHSCFFPECAAKHMFAIMCYQSCFFPECAANPLTAHSGKNRIGSTFWEKPWFTAHSGKKHD
jgi:hypothetical protein